MILRHFARLQPKYGLPKVRPVDLRHWVASACRRAGLSKPATAYMMGHDATQGGAMRDWYDNPQLEDVFIEQAQRLPRGPLGLLDPEVRHVEGLPQDAVAILREYLEGRMGTMELATSLEAIKTRLSVASTARILEA